MANEKNLKPFSSTYQPERRGRRPMLKNLPPDAREEIEKVLWHALTLPDQRTAQEYLKKCEQDLPKYGYLVQVYAKGLMGRNGTAVADQILDRLFGKPKQTSELNVGARQGVVQVTLTDPRAAAGLRSALADGAKPADPDGEDRKDG